MEDCQPARKMSRFGGCFAERVSNRSGVACRERGRHEGLSSAAGNSASIRLASGWIASSSVEARGSPRWPIGSAPSAEEPPRRTFRWRSRSRTGRSSRVSWTTGSRSTRSTRSSSTGSATTSRPSAPRTTASTPASSTRDAVGSVVEPWVLDLWAKVPTPSKARRAHPPDPSRAGHRRRTRNHRGPASAGAPGLQGVAVHVRGRVRYTAIRQVQARRAPHGRPRRLRDAVYHWAKVAVQLDVVSKAKYVAVRARALRSVADRLPAVACAMLRTQTCYRPPRPAEDHAGRSPFPARANSAGLHPRVPHGLPRRRRSPRGTPHLSSMLLKAGL